MEADNLTEVTKNENFIIEESSEQSFNNYNIENTDKNHELEYDISLEKNDIHITNIEDEQLLSENSYDEPNNIDNELVQSTEQQNNENNITTNFNNKFKTVATPDLLEELNKENSLEEFNSENSNNNSEAKQEEINSLFAENTISSNNNQDTDNTDISALAKNNKKTSKIVPIIGLITLLGGLGYLVYSKLVTPADISDNNTITNNIVTSTTPQKREDIEAMPVETVETNNVDIANKNEGLGTTISAIEQDLDASILVSNLKVDWEVPSGYASNTSAKRYLIKLGKILQLNLKTELLLLNKPPITNKIGVEIKFNENTKKFEPVGITLSSGEESVDNIILNTVKNTLSMNFSTNTNSISKLQGNPVLIIHL